jgi:hypothetical protein
MDEGGRGAVTEDLPLPPLPAPRQPFFVGIHRSFR